MGWSGTLHRGDVAKFHSYQEAKLYYDNTKQIRGRDKPTAGVPLRCDRRDRDTSLREHANGDMILRLYHTDIIIWHKDNETITVDASYNTQTTVNWANAYLPYGLRVNRQYGFAVLNGFYVCTNPMTFKKEGSGWALLGKPAQMVVERLDRTKAKAVREQSEEFYKYLRAMCAFEVTDAVVNSVRDSKEPFAQGLFKFGYITRSGNSNFERRFNFEHTKRNYTEAKYRESDAYYMEDLPLGTLHKNMRVKS